MSSGLQGIYLLSVVCMTPFFSSDPGKQLGMNIEKGPVVISISVGRKTWLIKREGSGASG